MLDLEKATEEQKFSHLHDLSLHILTYVYLYLHTGILFINKGFVRVEAKNSVVPGVTYPGRQTYSAVAFSFLEGVLEGVLLQVQLLA